MTGFWSSHGINDAHIGQAGLTAGRPPDGRGERGGTLTATFEGEAGLRSHVALEGGSPRDIRLRAIAMLSDLARERLVDEPDGHVVAAAVTDGAGKVVLAAKLSVETTWFDQDHGGDGDGGDQVDADHGGAGLASDVAAKVAGPCAR